MPDDMPKGQTYGLSLVQITGIRDALVEAQKAFNNLSGPAGPILAPQADSAAKIEETCANLGEIFQTLARIWTHAFEDASLWKHAAEDAARRTQVRESERQT